MGLPTSERERGYMFTTLETTFEAEIAQLHERLRDLENRPAKHRVGRRKGLSIPRQRRRPLIAA